MIVIKSQEEYEMFAKLADNVELRSYKNPTPFPLSLHEYAYCAYVIVNLLDAGLIEYENNTAQIWSNRIAPK